MVDLASVTRLVVCRTEALPPGEVLRVQGAGHTLALANVDGSFHAVDDLCSHGQASLSEGFLEGHVLECPFHGGAFDVRSGAPVRMPCTRALRTYGTAIEEGQVVVLLPAAADSGLG